MKAVNIVLLLLAGALSGALVMRVTQPGRRFAMKPVATQPVAAPRPADPTPKPVTVAQVQTPPPTPLPLPAQQPAPEAEAKPSPLTRSAPLAAEPEPPVKLRAPHTPPRVVRLAPPSPAPAGKSTVQTAERRLPPPDRPEMAAAAPTPNAPSPTTAPPALPEQPKETPPARTEPENATPASAPSAPQPNQATLNAGMLIPVRLLDSLSPERNHAGDPFAGTLDRELVANGFVIAERGARVEGRVTAADANAHTMSLELISVHTSDNQDVSIQTERFDRKPEPDHSNAAAKIGAGAAIGAVIGAVAGGGKGAAIGAGAGGSVGAGDVLLSRRAGNLPSETRLVFRLRAPVTITEQQIR